MWFLDLAARADAELVAGEASEELRLQRSKLEAQQVRMASMGRMLNAQLTAGQEAQHGERRLRAELSAQLAAQRQAHAHATEKHFSSRVAEVRYRMMLRRGRRSDIG